MQDSYGILEKDSSENYDQTEEEKVQVKRLMRKFNIWKKYRSRYDKNWMTYYKFFRGCQWQAGRPDWKTSEVINLIFQTIQSQIPIQTDVRPKFEFLAQEPEDVQLAKILESVSDSDWETYNWLTTVFEVLLDGWIYGTSYGYVGHDSSAKFGAGAITFRSEDVFYIYPDPDSGQINEEKSEGIIKAYPCNTAKLKQKYPDRAKYIKSNIKDFKRKERTDIGNIESTYFYSDKDLPEYTYEYNSSDEDDLPRTMVYEFYLKPLDIEETEESEYNELGEENKKYIVKKKYPNGRKVVIACGQILEDGDLEFEDNLIPFAKYNNYILPREFFGISEVENLKQPQIVFNKLLGFALDCLAFMGNPIWIVDNDSNIDTDELSNIPGGVVEKARGSEVRREMGVSLNPSIFQMVDRLVEWYNGVAGQSEFSQGSAPGGITAASAIEQLIQQSRTRIRQKQRNLDAFLKDAGRLYMNRVFQFYDQPRIFRLTNNQDGLTTFRKIYIDKNENGQKIARINDDVVDQYNQKMGTITKDLVIKGDFDVRVKTGSDLPFDIADKERKAFALFDRGIIDQEEVLTQIDYPNREKILQRLQEMQAQQAQAQQAQQQQGA